MPICTICQDTGSYVDSTTGKLTLCQCKLALAIKEYWKDIPVFKGTKPKAESVGSIPITSCYIEYSRSIYISVRKSLASLYLSNLEAPKDISYKFLTMESLVNSYLDRNSPCLNIKAHILIILYQVIGRQADNIKDLYQKKFCSLLSEAILQNKSIVWLIGYDSPSVFVKKYPYVSSAAFELGITGLSTDPSVLSHVPHTPSGTSYKPTKVYTPPTKPKEYISNKLPGIESSISAGRVDVE